MDAGRVPGYKRASQNQQLSVAQILAIGLESFIDSLKRWRHVAVDRRGEHQHDSVTFGDHLGSVGHEQVSAGQRLAQHRRAVLLDKRHLALPNLSEAARSISKIATRLPLSANAIDKRQSHVAASTNHAQVKAH